MPTCVPNRRLFTVFFGTFAVAMRSITIFTGTRADWGILSPVAHALSRHSGIELRIAATNMHLSEKFGHTIDEILADGFTPDIIAMNADAADPTERIESMSECMAGTARLIRQHRPDLAVILGDRFEMLAVATACTMTGVPIAHIAGGEISEGAIDDSIRHAITKLSSLHLTATEAYRRRVIQMGEDPSRVFNTGALGVNNLRNLDPISPAELKKITGLSLDRDTILVTYHPATLDTVDVAVRIEALTGALDDIGDNIKVLITYANNDADGARVNAMLETYAASRHGRIAIVPSLGRRRYHSVLRLVGAVVGNSSSGLVEVPSAGIPTVDIGCRQHGRMAGESVIHCNDSRAGIAKAIARALSPEMQTIAAHADNPYYKPDTLTKVVELLTETPLGSLRTKHFHDISTTLQ